MNQSYVNGFYYSIANARALFSVAESAGLSKEFGIGTSLMILAAEEAIKAQVCSMIAGDVEDFAPDDYKTFFSDHKTKHEHIKALLVYFREGQERLKSTLSDGIAILFVKHHDGIPQVSEVERLVMKDFPENVKRVLDLPTIDPEDVAQWWSQANSWKEEGLYVDKRKQGWHNPRTMSHKKYLTAKKHAFLIIELVDSLHHVEA